MFGNNKEALQILASAYEKIRAARRIDSANPGIDDSEQKLVDRYSAIIQLHLQDKDVDEAREFLDSLKTTGLGKSQLSGWERKVATLESENPAPVSVPTF